MKTKTKEDQAAYLSGGIDHMNALLETINEAEQQTYTKIELLQLIGAGIYETHRIAVQLDLVLDSDNGPGDA